MTKWVAGSGWWVLIGVMGWVLSGCSSGAVVYAPTPIPADISALVYTHPSGAFSVAVPRTWAVYEQNVTVLAATAFTPPAGESGAIRFAVVNTGTEQDSAGLGSVIDRYQTQVRPDVTLYTETDRQAMGDGSWRIAGVRQTEGGRTQQLNTFIQSSGSFVALTEVVLPDDPGAQQVMQQVVNTFTLNPQATIQTSDVDSLALATRESLEFFHVKTWTTPAGVFFITGEVANRGGSVLMDIPVRGVVYTEDGLGVVEAVDVVMGYGLAPGEFAPFSLRFGQGQPARTMTYQVTLGGPEWQPSGDRRILGADVLNWDDSSEINGDGSLVVSGTVRNSGTETALSPRATVTVFDSNGDVIAAAFTDIPAELAAGDEIAFRIVIPDLGGQPLNYIVNVQALGA
jgi:hypothetical protein